MSIFHLLMQATVSIVIVEINFMVIIVIIMQLVRYTCGCPYIMVVISLVREKYGPLFIMVLIQLVRHLCGLLCSMISAVSQR